VLQAKLWGTISNERTNWPSQTFARVDKYMQQF